MDAASILTAVVTQTGTDASRATLLSLLNEVYAQQVADSRWFRTQTSVGTVVGGQADYPMPDTLVEAYGLRVNNQPYTPIGEDQLWQLQAANLQYTIYRGGFYSPGYDSTGGTIISLFPTPQADGADINLYGAMQPPALTDSAGSTPITPPDKHSSLIEGVTALVLERIDERPDLAAPFTVKLHAATEVLRRRKNGLLRGGQPTSMLVKGIHW